MNKNDNNSKHGNYNNLTNADHLIMMKTPLAPHELLAYSDATTRKRPWTESWTSSTNKRKSATTTTVTIPAALEKCNPFGSPLNKAFRAYVNSNGNSNDNDPKTAQRIMMMLMLGMTHGANNSNNSLLRHQEAPSLLAEDNNFNNGQQLPQHYHNKCFWQ